MNKCDGKQQVIIPLFNVVDNGSTSLKWLEPCPSIHWAGALKQERSFLVNTNSNQDEQNVLIVKAFNPRAGAGTSIQNMMYREIGTFKWKEAKNRGLDPLNFADFDAVEDQCSYGYITRE